MPNFIKIGGTRASRQYGEMYTSRTFYIFLQEISRAPLQKNTQQFQALNDLKCSTVGNLSSWWAFVVMLFGFTHVFEGKSQKRSKFSNLEKFRPSNALHWEF